jgi:hypothetical protein
MSRPVEEKNPLPNSTSALQNRIANWAINRTVKDKTKLQSHNPTGKDISVKQGLGKTPEPAKVTPPQIERTEAPNTGSNPKTTSRSKTDGMVAYTPKKRTVNPERFLQ